MREFLIAAQRADATDANPEPEDITLPIRELPKEDQEEGDLREVTVHYPGNGAVAALMATNASFSSTHERLAGIVHFFVACLEPEDHAWVVSRMLDRSDPFDGEHVADMVTAIMEEWSGRPTQPSTGSTGSRSAGGRKSTRRTPASISSD